jgi:hypothetical protein
MALLKLLIFSTMILVILIGCAGKNDVVTENQSKYDASLRVLLMQMDRDGVDDEVNVFIRLSAGADKSAIDRIREYGVNIETTLDSILTVQGKASAIRKLSADPHVSSISLSQIRKPLQ